MPLDFQARFKNFKEKKGEKEKKRNGKEGTRD